VLGPRKLPEQGKGLGDGIRGFRSVMREIRVYGCQTPETLKAVARMSDPVLVFAFFVVSVPAANRAKISALT
jgi:hypothetical protein